MPGFQQVLGQGRGPRAPHGKSGQVESAAVIHWTTILCP